MTTMTETPEAVPAEERRGGEYDTDWDRARPGQPLPRKPAPELWDPPEGAQDCGEDDWVYDRDAAPLWHSCGLPGCGGT